MVRLLHNGELTAPRAIPKQVNMIKEEAPPPDDASMGVAGGVPGGVAGGSDGGVMGGILGDAGPAAPPPPKQAPTRIRLGGNVQQAKLVSQPMPVYPPLARQARIQGNVVLHAIISKDGHVEQLSVISGHPLLIQSALDAVRQWRYQPTLLNGDPVEVDTTITVTFTMGGN
jgi:protein TonB